ncbi:MULTISPECIES: SRPBCC family protein [unclassified Streptomyces]|uniref:SRPBCC family protein n=1 Tax=unclassified Streptomyces TaxID=2593676 RepID=UPI002DD93010|nr:SRPBCC family protein [Streptomyces sp. NBC_01775]WSB80694.1 SRPBCC family protein [Streptomyces sp. NBC_01775]WSS39805.1 SRPBCC family protein [Streptomyces sp. NBC_01187]
MALHRYRFRAEWKLAAPASRVFALLERAEAYPEWWPQVRAIARADEGSGTGRFRSVLPYVLSVSATMSRYDPEAGVLEIRMHGDLEGWARWTVRERGEGACVALFDQDVEVRKPLLRLLAVPGRPFFAANHALMMRSGLRGLRALLRRGLDEE